MAAGVSLRMLYLRAAVERHSAARYLRRASELMFYPVFVSLLVS